MYKARARQPLRDFAREHFIFTKARPGIAAFHDRARAPFLRRTSWQTLRNPNAHARATFCDWRDRHTARTRWMYAVLPGTGRPAATSFKSRERNLRRNQDQYFSTGFKSGLLGGTRHRLTDARSCAGALFAKKDSLSQSSCHGPRRRCSFTEPMAPTSFAPLTARDHSVEFVFLRG